MTQLRSSYNHPSEPR